MSAPLEILHVFSTFGLGGPQVRACQLMNAMGHRFSHTVVALDGHEEAAARIGTDVAFRIRTAPAGKGGLLYAFALYRMMREIRPDLLVTYNWGAFDAVAAGTAGSVCPVLHAEDGFGSDEADGLKLRRVWVRRAFANRVRGLVVPSRTLRDIAVNRYGARPEKVHWIVNGVDVATFRPGRDLALRAAWAVPDRTVLFGYTGRLSGEKNLDLLLRSFAGAGAIDAKLVLIGEGPCRGALERLAAALGIADRVLFAGFADSVARCYRALDVSVMSSVTEQMPMSLLEAMASGLPALCTDVGDSAEMLGSPEPPAVVPSLAESRYTESIRRFALDEDLRRNLGRRNRARAVARYSLEEMIAAYARLYVAAAGRQDCPASGWTAQTAPREGS